MSDRRLNEPLAPDEAELAQRLHVLPGGVPSAHVDAAILAAARAPRPTAPRSLWWLALSSAASLVLVVGLVWRMQPTLPQLDAPTAPSTPHPALREAASPASPDAIAADAEARRERTASPPTAPARMPPTATPESMTDALQRAQAKVETDAKATPPQSAAPTAANAPEAPKPPAQIVVTGTRVVVPPPADAKVEAARVRQKANAAPPPVVFEDASPMAIEAPPPAPPAPPAPMREPRDVLVAPPAASESAGADATSDATLNQEIEAIRQLQREGRQDLARERLRELIDRHPQWTVPDDLRRLLE
jgi:hypothetical protein